MYKGGLAVHGRHSSAVRFQAPAFSNQILRCGQRFHFFRSLSRDLLQLFREMFHEKTEELRRFCEAAAAKGYSPESGLVRLVLWRRVQHRMGQLSDLQASLPFQVKDDNIIVP